MDRFHLKVRCWWSWWPLKVRKAMGRWCWGMISNSFECWRVYQTWGDCLWTGHPNLHRVGVCPLLRGDFYNKFPPTFPGSYGLQFVAHPLRHQPGAPHDLHLHADVLPLHALQAQHQQEQDHRKVWTDAPLSRALVVKLSLAKLLFHRQQTAVFGSELLSGKNRKKACHWKWNKENWSVLSN